MEKFEHLLGQDPIGAFKKIKKDYVRYFKTAYHISDPKLDGMRMEEIEKDDNLYKEPYLEILPEYESYQGINSIEDLAPVFADAFESEDDAREFFSQFIKAGLMSYKPYGHQVGMMRKAFAEGKNVVITSGTGSGKTESFLLPLFAQLFKEAKTWPHIDYPYDWYNKNGNQYVPCQREKEKRPAALRALVLYPMNALVADQMARLRKALDSDSVRSYMDQNFKGNRFFFGGYNGETIGKKNFQLLSEFGQNKKKEEQQRVAEKLDEIHSRFTNITNYYNGLQTQEEKDEKEEVLYVNPRLNDVPTAEMLTRWDMQQTPPDIMITNVSMLSIMLMRKAEEDIFKQTNSWLAAKDLPEDQREKAKKDRIFHLILDELHLYRGTAGSEVACLVRMLLDTIGLKPAIKKRDDQGNVIMDANGHPVMIPNPQLRILASSASLGSTERGEDGEKSETEKYLEEFFGVYNSNGEDAFEVQKGSNYCPQLERDDNFDFTIFNEITPEFIELDESDQLEQMNAFAQRHGYDSIKEFTLMNQRVIFAKIYDAIPKNNDVGRTPRAISLSGLANTLFGGIDNDGNTPALRGFLIYRAFVDKLNENGTIKQKGEKALAHRLPRIRFHQFFKYIEGLWGELQPTMNSNGERAVDDEGNDISPINNVMYEAREVGESGNKILELLRCENCGELFIGGNRKERVGNDEAISLNYPDLLKMPNFNPTPMVQNKSYKDYMIFWPTHEAFEGLESAEKQVAFWGSGRTGFNATNGRGDWRHAYLHTKTGVVKETINNEPDKGLYIEGWKYTIRPYIQNQPFNKERIQALPCCCPHCAMNYARRIHVKSPIRSFRTGIDRSNQLLSKELMYQLSEKSQKLIGFSDSREDAAKQAYGIEKEQYRDMVRMLFIDCVNEINSGVKQVIDKIEKDRANGVTFDFSYILQFGSWLIPNAQNIAADYLSGKDISKYKKDYVDLHYFIDNKNNIDGLLVRKLVQLGINPAGVDYKDQFTNETMTNHWNRAYNWQTFAREANVNGEYRKRVYNNLTSAIFENSFGKYMGVSVLDSGIGYICCKRSNEKETSREYERLNVILSPLGLNIYDFIDAFIRILGDNYRYKNDEFEDPSSFGSYNGNNKITKKYKKYVKAAAENYRIDENTLGEALFNYFHKNESDSIILEYNKLGFRLLDENAGYYECPICHRIHPNKGMGVCTSCAAPLPNEPVQGRKVRDLWNDHFISFDIMVEKKKARRLHTEELTGQTDDIQTRLLEFKNLILLKHGDEQYRTGEERTKEIDMVNVTTTMEVGVDIGSLEAIFQGNMSPTRYNYQQRVGRGGRRGQAFSTAFTFCRGRSHDVHYYKNATEEIVGGLPAAPKLSLAPYVDDQGAYRLKLAIIKRVIAKNILKEAFKDKIEYDPRLHDTSGEFGLPFSWRNNEPKIEDWIRTNSKRIDDIIDLYTAQFNTADCDINGDIDTLRGWAKGTGLVDEVSAIAACPTYAEGLAQCLAEGGLLPMYGMPSDLREFYHGFNYDPKIMDLRKISRSTEMAINEFAPGSEKTKDKGRYRVEGLTTPLRYEKAQGRNPERIVPMNPHDIDALYNCYTMQIDPNTMQDISTWRIQNILPNNNVTTSKTVIANNLQPYEKMLIIPMAYRSFKLFHNDGKTAESNDRGSRFSQSTIFAKDNDDTTNKKDVENVRIFAYGLNLNDEAEVWHVNTNNNQLFKGRYASRYDQIDGVTTCHSVCPNCGSPDLEEGTDSYTCRNCGVVTDKSDMIEYYSSSSFIFYKRDESGNPPKEFFNIIPDGERFSFDIAIGSRKPTEMIKLEIIEGNDFVDINVTTGNESAIRAAFFSAAFLLQRTLADKLDVSPDEIEISDKIENNRPVIYLSDAAPNGAGIVSYLYQQGNLKSIIEDIIEFKTSFMQSLINDKHRHGCKTACQDCLLTYNNRGFHHIIDWRLGISLLRLMLNPNYDFGFNPVYRAQYQELSDYDELVAECAQKLRQDWTKGNYHQEARNIRGIDNVIIYNPLWNKVRLIALAKSDGVPSERLAIYNTFRLLRSDIENDRLPENVDQIPAMAINDQGFSVDPNTGIPMNITL